MLLKREDFIAPDLAIAPRHNGAKLPNLVLRDVFLDCNTTFEVWSPRSDAILSKEEVNFLKHDRLRIEVICTRLVWLLGATCCDEEDYLMASHKLFSDWEEVRDYTTKYGFRPDIWDIMFSPQTIRPLYLGRSQKPSHWVIEPPCWEICPLKFHPSEEGFKTELRSPALSILVWGGQPKIKSILPKNPVQITYS